MDPPPGRRGGLGPAVERLAEMGFDRSWCAAALDEADGDFDAALATLLDTRRRGLVGAMARAICEGPARAAETAAAVERLAQQTVKVTAAMVERVMAALRTDDDSATAPLAVQF